MLRLSKNQQVVRFLAEVAGKDLNRTRFMKAVFLADYQARCKLGKPITTYEYKFHHHGPYTRQVREDVGSLEAVGVLKEHRANWWSYGITKKDRFFYSTQEDVAYPNISHEERFILRALAQRCASGDLDSLLEEVYATPPMKRAQKLGRGSRIPMEDYDAEPTAIGVSDETIQRSIREIESGHGRPVRNVIDSLRARHFGRS